MTETSFASQVVVASLALGVLLAYLFSRWRNRPRVIPEPPKELPWVAAMRELDALRASGMLDDEERLDDLFDLVDHCTRRYLGERYGISRDEIHRKYADYIQSYAVDVRAA